VITLKHNVMRGKEQLNPTVRPLLEVHEHLGGDPQHEKEGIPNGDV
jgi:hypothetical protein